MKFTKVLSFLFLVACLVMGGEARRCTCPEDYTPVCGDNGSTYGNVCLMACAGIPLAHEGAC